MEDKPKPKRGYRSCLNCRARKARCSLGDVNAPRAPPCDRCQRERRVCEYAPSKRGGPKLEGIEKKWVPEELKGVEGSGTQMLGRSALDGPITSGDGPSTQSDTQPKPVSAPQQQYAEGLAPASLDWTSNKSPWELAAAGMPSLQQPFARSDAPVAQTLSHGNQTWFASPSTSLSVPYGNHHNKPPSGQNAFPVSFSAPPQPPAKEAPTNIGTTSTSNSGGQQPSPYTGDTPASYESSNQDGDRSLTGTGADGEPLKKKRKRNASRSSPGHRTSQRAIVVADMHNESDALNILAQAAMEGDDDGSLERDGDDDRGRRMRLEMEQRYDRSPERTARQHDNGTAAAATRSEGQHVNFEQENNYSEGSVEEEPPATLEDFSLIQMGIVSPAELVRLCQVFFKWHHPVFPLIPTRRIPQTIEQIALFADEEAYLLIAIVIITSRHDPTPGTREIHEKAWKVMKDCLSEINYAGTSPTVGLVEALLLLAENPPRESPSAIKTLGKHRHRSGHENQGLQAAENRQAWMMSGMAIRAAYGLGLDQLSRSDDDVEHETYEVQRARLAWTYCYIFDRHISLRTGRAFWSRGPSLCFRGYSDLLQSGPAAAKLNFPILAADGSNANDDGASIVQAYTELTQSVMTNAHDVLYPSTVRTHTLVEHGEYFKFLDDFNRALESFKTVWRHKQWATPVLKDLVSTMLHYVRLYISAFAFQAHVQRTHARAEKEPPPTGAREGQPRPPTSLFPRGSASTADAPYIYESINAAREILKLCAERLHPQGALRYLPSRFLLWFQYAAVFLLKAIYSGAMVTRDMQLSGQLIEKACVCLATASPDKDHPAVRYGHMIRVLSRKLAHMSDASAVPSRFPSPAPAAGHDPAFAATPQGADATIGLNLNNAFTPSTVAGANLDAWLQSTAETNMHQQQQQGQIQVTETSQSSAFFDDLFRENIVPGAQPMVELDIDFNLDGFWENFNPLIEANGANPL